MVKMVAWMLKILLLVPVAVDSGFGIIGTVDDEGLGFLIIPPRISLRPLNKLVGAGINLYVIYDENNFNNSGVLIKSKICWP